MIPLMSTCVILRVLDCLEYVTVAAVFIVSCDLQTMQFLVSFVLYVTVWSAQFCVGMSPVSFPDSQLSYVWEFDCVRILWRIHPWASFGGLILWDCSTHTCLV